jgi:hypothetical protein
VRRFLIGVAVGIAIGWIAFATYEEQQRAYFRAHSKVIWDDEVAKSPPNHDGSTGK